MGAVVLRRLGRVLALAVLLAPNGARSEDAIATLTLDGLSFLSFDGRSNLPIPPGSTVRFRFGRPQSDGSVSFTILPEDVALAPVAADSSGSTLIYSLAAPASGSMRKEGDSSRIEFMALVKASLTTAEGSNSTTYSLRFTTDTVRASDAEATATVSIEGMRLAAGTKHVQLVGAVTNQADAYPEPGAAVYTVLSGTFDTTPGSR
jgi:hypothetical protein